MEGIGFKANIIENHDEPRGASRFLPSMRRMRKGRKHCRDIRPSPRDPVYFIRGQVDRYGELPEEQYLRIYDISTIDQYQEAFRAGCTEEEALEYCYKYSRDNARTPMQWNDDVNGGFTKGRPWLAMNPDYTRINVEEQEKREDSVLSCYKKVIALRKAPGVQGDLYLWKVSP